MPKKDFGKRGPHGNTGYLWDAKQTETKASLEKTKAEPLLEFLQEKQSRAKQTVWDYLVWIILAGFWLWKGNCRFLLQRLI
jgi:hypothetical protein